MTYTYEINVPASKLRNAMSRIAGLHTSPLPDDKEIAEKVWAAADKRIKDLHNDDPEITHYCSPSDFQNYVKGTEEYVQTVCGLRWTPPHDTSDRTLCSDCAERAI